MLHTHGTVAASWPIRNILCQSTWIRATSAVALQSGTGEIPDGAIIQKNISMFFWRPVRSRQTARRRRGLQLGACPDRIGRALNWRTALPPNERWRRSSAVTGPRTPQERPGTPFRRQGVLGPAGAYPPENGSPALWRACAGRGKGRGVRKRLTGRCRQGARHQAVQGAPPAGDRGAVESRHVDRGLGLSAPCSRCRDLAQLRETGPEGVVPHWAGADPVVCEALIGCAGAVSAFTALAALRPVRCPRVPGAAARTARCPLFVVNLSGLPAVAAAGGVELRPRRGCGGVPRRENEPPHSGDRFLFFAGFRCFREPFSGRCGL